MEVTQLKEMFNKYGLDSKDVYQHKHYHIITRSGMDKIQAKENVFISYDPVKVEPEFCVVKAIAKKESLTIETFGSAKYGAKEWDKTAKGGKGGWNEQGNTTTWYVMEMAEKRAMSRAILKITGFYELGVFGEDESEDFDKKEETTPPQTPQELTKPNLKDSQLKAVQESLNQTHIMHFYNNCTLSVEQKTALELLISKFELDGSK